MKFECISGVSMSECSNTAASLEKAANKRRFTRQVFAFCIVLIVVSTLVAYVARDLGYGDGYAQGVTDGAGRRYNIIDPTYQETLDFIASDHTDQHQPSETYSCFDFTADVEKNAFKAGYRCGLVYIEFKEGAHTIVAFNTTDRGLTFIEPQDDRIVTLTVGQHYWDRTRYVITNDDTIVRFVVVW